MNPDKTPSLGFKAKIPQYGAYLLEKSVTQEPNQVPILRALILPGSGVLYCPLPVAQFPSWHRGREGTEGVVVKCQGGGRRDQS